MPETAPSETSRADSAPGPVVYIGTHHRCGTVYLRNVFTRFTKFVPLTFFKGHPEEAPAEADIVQDGHSRSPLLKAGEGIHAFRDPFALLLSHVRYHLTTEKPGEPPNLFIMDDGRTYGEHLKENTTLEGQAMFEIDNVFGRTLKAMLAWDYDNPRFLNLPLEAFFSPEEAERIGYLVADRFAPFTPHREILAKAFVHFVVNAPHVRQAHGTRVEGEEAKAVLPAAVIERLYGEFPSIRMLEERLARPV